MMLIYEKRMKERGDSVAVIASSDDNVLILWSRIHRFSFAMNCD